MILTTENTKPTEGNTESLNSLSEKTIGCAIDVHRKLGPGLLESAYQYGLAHLLAKNNIPFEKEKTIAVKMDELLIDAGYRADCIINNEIIIEIKSVSKILPIHEAQLLTYMKLGKFELGLILNFNEKLLKNGIKRMRL